MVEIDTEGLQLTDVYRERFVVETVQACYAVAVRKFNLSCMIQVCDPMACKIQADDGRLL